jgi:nucleoside-diphosphate-sugar epimerase
MPNVLVTGGGGFLGKAIVARLVARGELVRILQRSPSSNLAALGVECHAGNITDADAVDRAVAGCESVIHTAAKAGVWGRRREYQQVNVDGTKNVIDACRRHGIPRLVYTSSPSVVFDGRDENGIDERTPYARRFLAAYPKTKAQAEQLVLAANCNSLATVALRPHLIWGPGDPHLVPRIVERAKAGRRVLVGDGANLVDSTYIDNAADAHVLALDRLLADAPCAGRAYFISNGEPLAMADLLAKICAAAGVAGPKRRIGRKTAYAVGAALEWTYRLLRRKTEPPLTRFVAQQLATAHWFNLTAARRDLGYEPKVSVAVGMQQLSKALRGD